MGLFLIVLLGLTSTIWGCVCAVAPLLWISCVSISLFQSCWGDKFIEASKVFGYCGYVGCERKGDEVAVLSLRPLKLVIGLCHRP